MQAGQGIQHRETAKQFLQAMQVGQEPVKIKNPPGFKGLQLICKRFTVY
ncbi:hypothetical protein J3T65_06955 [Staphylococcus simiae]|nr:hypothetical protein [Staphylococcus simiae]MBO1199606.1 hypothetical protein [Staphylococcus simiae]MBO1201479.1 hypothetical protein [Staphylococcus simiae]MBO1203627.1 hypothetical protein [Staphylococcus simiae]QSY53057.1 hypothetical protein J3R86_07190 [Staphylococcus simiae]